MSDCGAFHALNCAPGSGCDHGPTLRSVRGDGHDLHQLLVGNAHQHFVEEEAIPNDRSKGIAYQKARGLCAPGAINFNFGRDI